MTLWERKQLRKERKEEGKHLQEWIDDFTGLVEDNIITNEPVNDCAADKVTLGELGFSIISI